jgi:ferredoxin
MKAYIDKDQCTGCGLCESTCPGVFRLAEDDLAEVYVDEIPASDVDAAMDAREDCPVSAITVE